MVMEQAAGVRVLCRKIPMVDFDLLDLISARCCWLIRFCVAALQQIFTSFKIKRLLMSWEFLDPPPPPRSFPLQE